MLLLLSPIVYGCNGACRPGIGGRGGCGDEETVVVVDADAVGGDDSVNAVPATMAAAFTESHLCNIHALRVCSMTVMQRTVLLMHEHRSTMWSIS